MKHKTGMSLLIGISSIFIFNNSCKTDFYWPSIQNVPLLKEKKELMGAVGTGFIDMNIQGAYSITNHIGCQITYNDHYDPFSSAFSSGQLFEVGLGYYLRHEKYLAFETYGGYGYGQTHGDNYYNRSVVNFNQIYLQPSIGFTSDYFDLAFTPKIIKVDYIVKENIVNHQSTHNDLMLNMDKQSYYFIEPGITVRAGYKFIKLQFQYVEVLKQNKQDLDYSRINYSFSLFITIPLKNITDNNK